MSVMDRVHGSFVHNRRVLVLAEHIAGLLPRGGTVLDVGCGDGLLARWVMDKRPDVSIRGIDVRVRDGTHIPVDGFDGTTIPYADKDFDAVMFVDVLHHTDDPMVLLIEANRVARRMVVIKDHLLAGFMAGATLRFMDRVGNARHDVALPHNYWSRQKWHSAIEELGMRAAFWEERVGLYPVPASWLFGRSLHFVARLDVGAGATAGRVTDRWEAAYERFETSGEEVRKFMGRLARIGAASWPRDAKIVELFCGRGNGMKSLERLGFTDVTGVDLSKTLIAQYAGPARCCVADCRHLPLAGGCKQIAIVQGGLHHLRELPGDLEDTVKEIYRVLEDNGRFVMVEPWLTPFLSFVHFVCGNSLARRMSAKVDSLATMIHHERRTYEQWLGQPDVVRKIVLRYFEPEKLEEAWGKLVLVGRKRRVPTP